MHAMSGGIHNGPVQSSPSAIHTQEVSNVLEPSIARTKVSGRVVSFNRLMSKQ